MVCIKTLHSDDKDAAALNSENVNTKEREFMSVYTTERAAAALNECVAWHRCVANTFPFSLASPKMCFFESLCWSHSQFFGWIFFKRANKAQSCCSSIVV
jgi:hypothetical protein